MPRSDFKGRVIDMPDEPGRPVIDDPGNKPGGPPTDPPEWQRPWQPGGKPGGPLPPDPNPPIPTPPTTPGIDDPPPSEKPGTPGPPLEPSPNPQGPGTGGDFSKGQPYGDVTGPSSPPAGSSFYGDDGFDPYFGRNTGIKPGGGATSYDPLGIGKDAYTDPNADVWSMTGVNSVLAPGSKVKPRYGVVGGNGGYGYGMVGQDYSGPLANDPRGLVRGLRQQRRQLNRMGHARPGGPGVVNGPGGFGPKTGGAGTVTGGSGGQFGPAGGDMDWKGQPAGGSGGGATGGAGTTTGGQGGKWGAPPPAAGANTGGASPEPALLGGGTGAGGTGMGPSTSALDAALPGGAGANLNGWTRGQPAPQGYSINSMSGRPEKIQPNGTSSHPGLVWWNGVEIIPQGNNAANDQYAADMTAQRNGTWAESQNGAYRANINGQWLDLVTSSGGNSNVYKVNGQSGDDLYHYDPNQGWKHMTLDEYRGYGDYDYYSLDLADRATRDKAGQVYRGGATDTQWKQNGVLTPYTMNATAAWNPDPNHKFAPDKWDKRRQTGSF